MVRMLASSKTLVSLSKFIWADEELPFYDDMWFALRVGCVRHAVHRDGELIINIPAVKG